LSTVVYLPAGAGGAGGAGGVAPPGAGGVAPSGTGGAGISVPTGGTTGACDFFALAIAITIAIMMITIRITITAVLLFFCSAIAFSPPFGNDYISIMIFYHFLPGCQVQTAGITIKRDD